MGYDLNTIHQLQVWGRVEKDSRVTFILKPMLDMGHCMASVILI